MSGTLIAWRIRSIPNHPEAKYMIKKIIVLAAGALLSMNASAGYVQYNLTGPVSGFFIQHDDDKTIAMYELGVVADHVWARFFPSGGFDNITGASTVFRGAGPTNFSIYDDLTDYYFSNLDIGFSSDGAGGYNYSARYGQQPIPGLPIYAPSFPLTITLTGHATLGTVSPFMAGSLDSQNGYADGLRRIVPTLIEVPEPTSLALFAIGALGAAGVARRRKSQS